jgi:hypothetical protein
MKQWMTILALAGVFAAQARAADVGLPVFPKDLKGMNEWELSYQNLKRDLDNGPTLEADTYLLRLHTDLGQTAFLDIDLGAIDADGAAFYGGVGLRYLAYDGASFRLSPFAQLHYGNGNDSDELGGEFNLLQGNLGFLLAARLPLAEGLELQPYAGPMLSIVNVDGDKGGDADEDHVAGGVIGLALIMPDRNSIRAEAQFFDEVSISAAVSIVFP